MTQTNISLTLPFKRQCPLKSEVRGEGLMAKVDSIHTKNKEDAYRMASQCLENARRAIRHGLRCIPINGDETSYRFATRQVWRNHALENLRKRSVFLKAYGES
jgi:hypothetical protein